MKVKCEFCKGKKLDFHCHLSPKLFHSTYSIYICKTCGVGYTVPSPCISTEHYEIDIRPEIITDCYSLEIRNTVLKFIEKFKDLYGKMPRNLVDIGCGNGLTLFEAKGLGLDVMGVEPSRGMSEVVRRKGISVFNGYLEDFKDLGNYEIIILNSVIEHLPDPQKALTFLQSHMAQESIIIFQQAVYDGLIPKMMKSLWYGWSPSEHFWHFTENSFASLLKKNSFELIKVERENLFYQYSPLNDLRHWKSFLFSNFSKLLSVLAGLLGLGDSINFYAVKWPVSNR